MPAAAKHGVLVTEVERGTPAWRAGVRKGDLLLALNGEPLRDVIDYMYGLGDEEVTLLDGLGHMPHHIVPDDIVAAIDRVAGRAGLR